MRWNVLLPASALVLLLGLLYLPVLRDLWLVWGTDLTYSYGFLIPPVAAYLVWSKRESLSRTAVRPSFWGAGPLAGGLFLLLLGEGLETVVAGVGGLFCKGVSLTATLAGLAWLIFGRGVLKPLLLPLAYLLFMVPLPGGVFKLLTLPLQDYASSITTSFLQLVGIPALREGNVITLPSMALGVVEACSGIRSVFSLLALAGAGAVVLIPDSRRGLRWVLFASAVPIAVLTNAMRVTATGLVAHLWGAEVAQGFFHDFSGWLVFVVAFLILLTVSFLLNGLSAEVEVEGSHDAVSTGGA